MSINSQFILFILTNIYSKENTCTCTWTYHSTAKNSKLDEIKMQQKKEVPDVILKFNKLVLPPVVAKQ